MICTTHRDEACQAIAPPSTGCPSIHLSINHPTAVTTQSLLYFDHQGCFGFKMATTAPPPSDLRPAKSVVYCGVCSLPPEVGMILLAYLLSTHSAFHRHDDEATPLQLYTFQ